MKGRVNRQKVLSQRGAILIGLGLLIIGLAALLVLGPDLVLGQVNTKGKPDKPPGKSEPAFYRVYLIPQGDINTIATTYPDCTQYGFVLAVWDDAWDLLRANGTLIDPDLKMKIPLFMQLLTDVRWTRKYPDVADGVFNGCYGETPGENGYHGALFIKLGKKKSQSIIRFTWYFGYYTASNVLEHFALFSEDIPFPTWTGEDIIDYPVTGWFDLQYYLNDLDHKPSYESFNGGAGLTFNFLLTIQKITLQ